MLSSLCFKSIAYCLSPLSNSKFQGGRVLAYSCSPMNSQHFTPCLAHWLTFRTYVGYIKSSLMIPKSLIQKETVADRFLPIFIQIGKQNLKGEKQLLKGYRAGSLIEVRTKENLMSRTPEISPHSWTVSPKWPGRYSLRGKEHITGDRHSPSAFAVHVFISESVTEWVVPEQEEPICVGETLVCPQRQLRTEKKIQSLLTQTLQNSISYYVSTTTLNPPASQDYICELTKPQSLD